MSLLSLMSLMSLQSLSGTLKNLLKVTFSQRSKTNQRTDRLKTKLLELLGQLKVVNNTNTGKVYKVLLRPFWPS